MRRKTSITIRLRYVSDLSFEYISNYLASLRLKNIIKTENTKEEVITHSQSVVFNTTTAGLAGVKRNSVININNIVNINNGSNNSMPATTITNNKTRAESFPLSEVEMLRQEINNQKKSMEKIKKQNQLLTDENNAMKKIIETGCTPPPQPTITQTFKSHSPLSASFAIVKVL